MSRTLTVGILFVSWFCIVSVTEAALGTSCNETADSSNCGANESCTNSSCVCSDGYFDVDGNCVSNSISVTLQADSNSKVYGSSVVLTATITSAVPVDTVQWQKEEKNIDITQEKYTQSDVESNEVTLTITNIVTNDGGRYRVQVNNSAGIISSWSTPVTLTVTGEKPYVMVPGTITETDTTVTIHCNASVSQGSPALTAVYWLFKGANLSSSDSNKYSNGNLNTQSLTVNSIGPTDAGEYRCVATNLVGSNTSSQSVNLAPPSNVAVTQQPSSSIIHGSKVTFTGSYSSVPLNVKDIKWQIRSGSGYIDIDIKGNVKYNGSNVTGSSPKLIINPVQFIDETSYQLVVSNGVGSASISFSLSIENGELTVTIGPGVNGRIGRSVTINCNVNGPEPSKVQWIKYINGNQGNIKIDGSKYSGGSTSSPNLIINSLNATDAAHYECTASNKRGTVRSATNATVTVNYGQFNEDCSDTEPCDPSKKLICTISNKCLCMSTYYHKEEVCYEQKKLEPINIYLNSTTSSFFVFWSPPNTDSELVSEYEVIWRVLGTAGQTSGRLSKSKNKYNVSNGLISGQLYIVNVISHVSLTSPTKQIPVPSPDSTVRTVPSAPGPIKNQSHFAHNDLQINWNAPVNTVVTKYEITIDGTKYATMSNDTMYHFMGKNFVPGKSYVISIVTVSGTTSDIVKRSPVHTEWIRITPTKPNPPTNLQCPQSPLDISLEISWTAPTEPNGLILMYQIDVSPGNLQMYTSSNKTHKNVEGLSPEQMYNFTVRTVNDANDSTSEPSQPKTCKTKAGVSTAPTNLEINEVQSTGFKIEFNKPDNVSGILAAYKIVILKGVTCVQQILIPGICSNCNSTHGCPPPINYSVPDITNNNMSYTATGLMPYTHYMVKVVAINGEGDGHPANETVNTNEEVPLKPGQITANKIENSSLTLAWTLTDPSPGNTTYTIYTYESIDATGTNFLMNKSSKVYGFDTKTLLVTGLDEYWPYKFKVNAATVKGNTTSEFSSVFRTKQGAPGQVLNLTVQKKGKDFRTAYVSWSPPALRDHNGVLQSYLFSSNHTGANQVVQIPALSSQAKVEKNISVTPEAVYVIEVVLQNNESTKSQPSMQIYRAPAGPPPVTNIDPLTTKPGEHKSTTKTITIEINTTYFKNNDNGKQVFVGVAVCAESKCKDKKVMPESTLLHDWKDLPNWHVASKDGFPLYRVTNDTFKDKVINGSRRRRSVNSGSTTELVIGEDITCPSLNKDVYCNGQLSAGKSYNVIIFACTSGGCTYSEVDGAFSTQKVPEEEDNAIKIIIGVVGAVVVVAVIVGVAFVVVRRRNRLGETKQYTKGLDNQTTFDEPVPKNIPRKRPIKLKELCDKVAEKHKDSNLHFAREYEDLKALSPKHPAETSELDNNKLKNRYVNILPFDHSRVKLMLTEDDDPSTDFINANYLPGYKSQREYIATQGPIPGTIDDFWRMIWEQNVSIIVMLTLCKEEGRVKCEMYWPENIHEPKQYGDLVVETVSNSTVNFYEFRIFKIKLGDTTRSVKHFHFLQWKDFSANVQNDVMIDFIKNVRNHIRPPDMNGPVVVHCSAGVGRTGTYCALDHLFQFVDEHDLDESIDIFDLVMNLRERRMFMVQTEQQYIFIHDCLKDYLEKKLAKDECLYENQAFVADDEPVEESLYQNYSNQRTDL